MIRREFLGLLSAAAAWSLAAKADQRIPLIGILDPDVAWLFDAFVDGMRALGYEEGRNIRYERRSLHGKPETVGALAAELVALKPNVLVTVADSFVRILQQATSTIPIVFLAAGAPVASGIIDSFAHPGRRTTGLSFDDDALSTKRLDLLRQLVPGLHEVGILYAASAGKNRAYERTESTARALGLAVRGWSVGSQEALSSAFQDASDAHVQALDVLASPFFNVNANRTELVQLAATHRLPAIYESAEYVRTGGLIGYGPVFVDMARRGATLVDKILKGADPRDIPVEITTKFALSINLKASAALGLDVPPMILAAADEVIA